MQGDGDNQSERELLQLERKLKELQNECEASSRRSKLKQLKQMKIIELLEKEKAQIQMILDASKAKPITTSEEKVTQEIQRLIAEEAECTKILETKNQHLQEMRDRLTSLKKSLEIENQKENKERNKMVGALKTSDIAEENLEKQIHVENERFGKVLTENRKLKQEIADHLQERKIFDKFFEGISQELNIGKKIVFDIVEDTTHIFDERQNVSFKLNSIKARVKQNLVRTAADMQEIQRETHQVAQLNEFIAKKSQKRSAEEAEAKEALKKEEAINLRLDHLNKYRDLVSEITEKFKESDLEHLVMQFLKLEEDNYNVYTFNNGHNMRLEQLKKEVNDLEIEIAEKQNLNKSQEKKIKVELTKLKEILDISSEKFEHAKLALKNAKNSFALILKGIDDIFHGVYCETESIEKSLGRSKAANEYNVMQYLNAIEKKLLDTISLLRYQLEKNERRIRREQGIQREETMLSCTTTVQGTIKDHKEVLFTPAKVAMTIARVFKTTCTGRRTAKQLEECLARHTGMQAGNSETKTPCPLCVEKLEISEVDETIAMPLATELSRQHVQEEVQQDNWRSVLHDISECKLPESRQIIQRQGISTIE